MSWTARPAGIYDGSGADVLVASTASPAHAAVIADRGRVRALGSWMASHGMAHDAVIALDQDEVRLDPATAARVAVQLRRASQVLRTLPVLGLAWFDDERRVIVGGTLGPDLEHGSVLMSSSTCEVSAHVDDSGAYLLVRDSDGVGVRVQRWAPGKGGQVLADGQSVTPDVGAVLRRLWDGSASVGKVPATSVVAGLLTTAQEMAQDAASTASSLALSSARPGPVRAAL